jgi:ADP-ribose pyrophosphatase YjhB (NUDIX family)
MLRLGVVCAVVDDEGRLLLSQRGDLGVWGLPGGRLDAGERLDAAAAREVLEETGVVVKVERAVGLYYLAAWKRMNVLFAGWPLGGALQARTDEARANAYFPADALPPMPLDIMALDALAETRHKPRVIATPPAELRRLRLRLARRWVGNWLSGRPEAPFPRFNVRAVGIILSEDGRRVLTVDGGNGLRALPRVICDGETPPWEALAAALRALCRDSLAFRWAGVWQDASADRLEFVFTAAAAENSLRDGAAWSPMRNTTLVDRDAAYIDHVKPSYSADPVWMLYETNRPWFGETMLIHKENEE